MDKVINVLPNFTVNKEEKVTTVFFWRIADLCTSMRGPKLTSLLSTFEISETITILVAVPFPNSTRSNFTTTSGIVCIPCDRVTKRVTYTLMVKKTENNTNLYSYYL